MLPLITPSPDAAVRSTRTAMCLLVALVFLPGVAAAQAVQPVQPGRWDVVSTAVDLVVPGVPGFLLRMMKGRSRTEHKCVTPDQASAGVAALLTPDPKAKCRIESQQVIDGRFSQAVSCPHKQGAPMRIVRSGTYDAAGFAGQARMAGQTPKKPMAITIDQTARHLAGNCHG